MTPTVRPLRVNASAPVTAVMVQGDEAGAYEALYELLRHFTIRELTLIQGAIQAYDDYAKDYGHAQAEGLRAAADQETDLACRLHNIDLPRVLAVRIGVGEQDDFARELFAAFDGKGET